MILDLIVSGFLGLLNALFSLIPGSGEPATTPNGGGVWASNDFSGVTSLVWGLNGIIPIDWLLGSLVFMIALEIGLQVWDLAVWVFHQFWGSD